MRATVDARRDGDWVDAGKDGCSTRNEVLLEEAVNAPEQSGRCTLTGGTWYSPYDDTYVNGARGLDIDHLVPLAEAWDSGAGTWTAAEREAYANDLDDQRALIAVTARSNRSKADQDPATWQPPAETYRCQYYTDWVTIKTRWQLAIDPAEQTALEELADACPNTPVTVETARSQHSAAGT
ncbi:HNH endonuclease family protein [Streptomyces sp. KMM 9044]|uniref:HNH endonuclease family protein n=1 Tax=Streptomyces sp. KMM 9044 TaxID=2744474 RepID=UPI002151D212|nr:HNH endonuclease family protein [Streptomyces sp. KMM 9044]WAX79626.1 HNH endonuclease family protein [Streptomyces sp. KMM 9044]